MRDDCRDTYTMYMNGSCWRLVCKAEISHVKDFHFLYSLEENLVNDAIWGDAAASQNCATIRVVILSTGRYSRVVIDS